MPPGRRRIGGVEAEFGPHRPEPVRQLPAVVGRCVRAASVEALIARHQLRPGASEPAEEPFPGSRTQVQSHGADSGDAGGRQLSDQITELLRAVGQIWQQRCDEHTAGQTGVADPPDQLEPGFRAGRAGLEQGLQIRLEQRERDPETDRHPLCGVGEQREVPGQHGALGQDREGRVALGQRRDDAGHQPVSALGPLVGVGVRTHRDVLALPALTPQFSSQHLGHVDLDDDLGVEVAPGVELQVGVGAPGEAVDAAVGTAAIGVDGPGKRHRRRAGDAVQGGLRVHFVKGDPGELGRPDGSHQARQASHSGQRGAVLRVYLLLVPPHDSSRTYV